MTSKQKTAKKRAIITAVPLVLVNAVAFSGQFAYINDHVDWVLPAQVVFALALESVALFLAYMAHQALMAEDSAYGLRLSSYAFGAIIGLMNYSHYAGPGMKPTFEAVATGLMSVSSPWLWGIYSRRQSRDALKARNMIEPRAVKLGAIRWSLFPVKSWKVFRLAAWRRVDTADEAITAYEVDQATALPTAFFEPGDEWAVNAAIEKPESNANEPSPLDVAETKADAVRVAMAELGESVTAAMVADWLGQRGWDVKPNYARTAIARERVRHERQRIESGT